MKLTSKLIKEMDGSPIRLTSDFAEGKVLTVNPAGDVFLASNDPGNDQYWRLIPVDNGFLISSLVDGFIICHSLEDGSNISTVKNQDESDCAWKVGTGGEFYQLNPEGGERYLWLANNKLYATTDGYLAENWIPLNMTEHLPALNNNNECKIQSKFIIIIIAIIITLLFLLFWY